MARKAITSTNTPDEAALTLLLKSSPDRRDISALLQKISMLVDLAGLLKHPEATQKALEWCEIARKKKLDSTQRCLLDFYTANAWISHHHENKKVSNRLWEQPEIENAIFHLKKAVDDPAFLYFDELLRCKILTNLANQFCYIGGFIRAIDYWNRAIETDTRFGMALGNRGKGIADYAEMLHNEALKPVFLGIALDNLADSTNEYASYVGDGQGKEYFRAQFEKIEALLNDPNGGKTAYPSTTRQEKQKKDKEYRKWCLSHKLYLNPLNDLNLSNSAAYDMIEQSETVPSSLRFTPPAIRFLAQIKQEYVAARRLTYEAITSKILRQARKNIGTEFNTDTASYSMAVETLKLSYHSAWSLFAKIARTISAYYNLKLPENKINLRTIWYQNNNPSEGLRSPFNTSNNWPLRGLFWLSKELPAQRALPSINTDSDRLQDIAGELESRYLRVMELESSDDAIIDQTISREKLEKATLEVFKLVRSALVYLTLALHIEEQKRKEIEEKNTATTTYADIPTRVKTKNTATIKPE